MEDRMVCNCLSIHTTTICTLRCAKCAACIPKFKSPVVADVEKTVSALEQVFKIYDNVEELRFTGAEAFLYPGINALMESAAKYSPQFQYGIIVTNGTYIPAESILECIKHLPYRMIVRIDNYGNLSTEKDRLISILHRHGIEVDERIYTGENQIYGGWVDLGDCVDRHYSEDQLKQVFTQCRQPDDGAFLFEDKLTNCCHATMCYLLGEVPMRAREVVDLSNEKTIEGMKNKVRAWRDEPFEACKYCSGFDPVNSPRIPAAEQLEV